MNSHEEMKIRPYARLLTMLGDQLIKNERIALIEIIKNSYDADSPWVKVSFERFGNNFEINDDSEIIIEDAGTGMTKETIINHWLNPATPEKKLRKIQGEYRTALGRTVQGEKGIGRYALLKLGKKITVITRHENSEEEFVIEYDFSLYNEDFLEDDNKQALFLDDLTIKLSSRKPISIIGKNIVLGRYAIKRSPNGTKIVIGNLKNRWSADKIEAVANDSSRLQSIFLNQNTSPDKLNDFRTYFYINSKYEEYYDRYLEKLRNLLDDNAVLRITDGVFNDNKNEFNFNINGTPKLLKLSDPELRGLKIFDRANEYKNFGEYLTNRAIECGSFTFSFYVFDFSNKAPAKYQLDREDKKIIINHRIYVYRDGIRVYPYGEPDDDWLRIDAYRGTISAGQFLSNDQVVGFVNISQIDNPKLIDKTNREGLIEEGYATSDFITLVKLILAYLRAKPYARYKINIEGHKEQDIVRTDIIKTNIDDIKNENQDNKYLLERLSNLEKSYTTEKKYLIKRAELTEELAGIGLSVEAATHDINSYMSSALNNIDGIISDLSHNELDITVLKNDMMSLRGMITFIEAKLKDIQLLFKSTKKRRKLIKVNEIVEKVYHIYKRLLVKQGITCTIKPIGSPLVAKTTDAVLLQLLINLFDNAVYWLRQTDTRNKTIQITLNGDDCSLIFSDNGKGVDKDDIPYIFEAFYSGKGEEGRGLGLYIARQLLMRHDYSIELIKTDKDKILNGANFKVEFIQEAE